MRGAKLALIAFLSVVCRPQEEIAQKAAQPAPTVFNPGFGNAGFENAKAPSDAVLDAVLKKVQADDLAEDIATLGREQKRSLFEVVPVVLGPAGEEDFVVHGKPPMIGADCEWFWIVRVRDGKGQAVLFANGLALEIEKHVTNRYRDIKVSWATAAFTGERVFRFSDSNYEPSRERTREQRP